MPVINKKQEEFDFGENFDLGPTRTSIEKDGRVIGLITYINVNISLDMRQDGKEFFYAGDKYIEASLSAILDEDGISQIKDFFDIRIVRGETNTLLKNCYVKQYSIGFMRDKTFEIENCIVVAEKIEDYTLRGQTENAIVLDEASYWEQRNASNK